MTEKKPMSLTARIIIGMVAGISAGGLLQWILPKDGDLIIPLYFFDFSIRGVFVDFFFEVGGQIFISSLKMLVVPLVFVSLICGTCSISDTSKLGQIGGRAVGLYLITTAIAISLAMTIAILIAPGEGVNMTSDATYTAKEAPSLAKVFIDMFPSNPFAAFTEGNMLQIIVFALLFGIAMALSGEAGERVAAVFEDLNEVIMRLVTILMNLAPYGVFCLLAKTFTDLPLGELLSLAYYFMVVFGVLLIHALVTYPVILKALTGLNPLIF